MSRISQEHLQHWRDYGYVVVENFLTPQELATAQNELRHAFPTREEYEQAPLVYRNDYRGGHMRTLPFLGDVLNFMAVHPEIVSFVERALGTRNIALAQSIAWARYPEAEISDYPLHVDYKSSSLLYPDSRKPVEVTFILYYVDIDEELGATYVVSKQYSKDELLVPDSGGRDLYPELYRHEQPVYVRAGSMLIYSMSTFHRLSQLTSRNRTRYSHHIIYRAEDAPWVGYSTWTNFGQTSEMQRFIEQASPRQRELFGFPSPGHAYWNEETLAGIAARYPLMDMTPYLEASGLSQQLKARLRRAFQQERTQDSNNLAYDYCRGIADYYAATTGVAAEYWVPWLLAYFQVGSFASKVSMPQRSTKSANTFADF